MPHPSLSEIEESTAIVDGVDHVATEMEQRWGAGRLRLLVGDDLRLRFDRQVEKWGEAVSTYNVVAIRNRGAAMKRAWAALDAAAVKAGAKPLTGDAWEVRLKDGRVLAIVKTDAEMKAAMKRYESDDRDIALWSADEIGRFVQTSKESEIADLAKRHFRGAVVSDVRAAHMPDPDDAIPF